jgi:STE24 endopeptidase
MHFETIVLAAAIAVIVARWVGELVLESLNRRYLLNRTSGVPDGFKGVVDETTYKKSVQYTLAKSHLSQIESTYGAIVLLVALLSGLLPSIYQMFARGLGTSAWAMAGFLFATGLMFALSGLPLDWYQQFRLEERFGFNTTTPPLWWLDRFKGALLAAVLGYPLLALILKFVDWTGASWWLWAWSSVIVFQLVMVVAAPVLILPLFNKLTPLPEGTLRHRLLALGRRTGFEAKSILVMDGSKRSRHSNAFFTGFGRFRKIVLFDTLIQQLAEPELEAVLAHEIGHYKKRHIPKMIVLSAAGLFLGFFTIAWLARQPWLYTAFGFPRRKHRPCSASVRVAQRRAHLLVLAAREHLVASIRVPSGRLRCQHYGRSDISDRSVAQADRKKPEQLDAAPSLQRLLLLPPNFTRTRGSAVEVNRCRGSHRSIQREDLLD